MALETDSTQKRPGFPGLSLQVLFAGPLLWDCVKLFSKPLAKHLDRK